MCCALEGLPWHSARHSSRKRLEPGEIGAPLLDQIVALAAPPLCAVCAATREPEAVLCERCAADLAAAPSVIEPGPPGVDLAVAASPFDGVAREVVHGLKYSRRLALAGVAAASMRGALPAHESADGLVPVPAGPWRRRWRGFDPAEEIAWALAERLDLPLAYCLRRAHGRRQVGRRRADRLADPPNVWAQVGCPRRVLLVDDVWTTGATLSACARALREGGTRRVVALTLARTI